MLNINKLIGWTNDEGLTFDESSVSVKYKQTNGVEPEQTKQRH